MTDLAPRAAAMQRIRVLTDQAVPDPSMRLTLLLAISDFGYATASHAIDDYMTQRDRLRQINLPFGEG